MTYYQPPEECTSYPTYILRPTHSITVQFSKRELQVNFEISQNTHALTHTPLSGYPSRGLASKAAARYIVPLVVQPSPRKTFVSV